MVQATEQYWSAQVRVLELRVQELESELDSLKELEKAQALAQKKAMEWDLG
jgi:hypothetical protein